MVPMDGLVDHVKALLETIQRSLLARAVKFREDHTSQADTYEEFKRQMEGRPGFVIAGWCGSADCEALIKSETQATLRNIPLASTNLHRHCVKCGKPSAAEAWFAKAY